MLVRIDEVVVGGIVQEDEAEPDGETTESRARPVEVAVRSPGENEEADRNTPAANHHRDQADFGRWLAVVLRDQLEVVLVYEWCTAGAEHDTDSDWYEHEASGTGAIALALLVNDWVSGTIR